jgi:hypothetical protein
MKIKSYKNQYEMQDPIRQYPRPEFPGQTQSPPGLASEMNPKPDHGEESYQGFGRLKRRKALITGADSGIGRAVTIACPWNFKGGFSLFGGCSRPSFCERDR